MNTVPKSRAHAGWDRQHYGSVEQPLHQSHLNELASSYGCPKRFSYRQRDEAVGKVPEWESYPCELAIGNAVHAVLALHLRREGEDIVRGLDACTPESLHAELEIELDYAADGKPIDWKRTSRAAELDAAVEMVRGALRDIGHRASKILLVEAPYKVAVQSGPSTYWAEGTVDLVYLTKLGNLALADWKSGQRRPDQVLLDHGYQLGLYAHALEHGCFFDHDDPHTEMYVGKFPDELYLVHLRDYVPYKRGSKKAITSPDEAAFYGVNIGATVSTKVGEQRGPAWYRARRKAEDVARLKVSVRHLVAGVRLGVFNEYLGEHCKRCPYAAECLGDGHVDQSLRKQLEASLRVLGIEPFDGLEESA